MHKIVAGIVFTAFAFACQDEVKETGSSHTMRLTVETYGDHDSMFLESFTTASIIANGFVWSEGPVWDEKTHSLLISDLPGNTIYQWSKEKGQRVYLEHAGFSDTLDHRSQDGSNGLAIDKNNQLIICQSGARRIVRMKTAIGAPAADYEVLADNYQGKKFNSPNDLVIDHNNAIYFTDPVYGLPEEEKDPTRELNHEGIYRISHDGSIRLLIDSISRPNGITLSPDEKTLYIASSDEKKPAWYAYKLSDSGTIVSGGLFLDALALREKAAIRQSPDGLKTDHNGTIYSSGPDGICMISPRGKLVGLIKIKDRYTSNCAFNAAKDSLYITVDDIVLLVPFGPASKRR
jgi:gluconolactonase